MNFNTLNESFDKLSEKLLNPECSLSEDVCDDFNESLTESETGVEAYAQFGSPSDFIDGYAVYGYYDENCKGLENSDWCSNWEEVEDLVHQYISKGDIVRIKNNETGNDIIITPDEYWDNFEGQCPVSPQDVEEGHMYKRIAKLDSFDLGLDEAVDKEYLDKYFDKQIKNSKSDKEKEFYMNKKENALSELEKCDEALEKEGGPFWYYSKHGIGPGTIPKGVEVIDVVEDDDFNTWIALDKVLTTSELEEFELKEQTPPDLNEDNLKEDSEFEPKKKFRGSKSVIKR